ncbi:DUF4135 domain-containing protein [Corallococcus sp. BB11-1]|uniref:DUF4135 domain-containing protein n=1 Tax=Corallococcus sp. BB11-1 TaxID=2996783 RepID=UPI0022701C60|nr:DUF4135 domain-containing protein [Corallococcus sp. BB11-1]MCY1036089.1 DUF4135 domain-containing protein [Corallococcus sp. BB11-1]
MPRKTALPRGIPKPRPGPLPPLPPRARGLVEAVRRGRATGFFPPVVREGPEGVLQVARALHGEEDARRIHALLARPGFRPLVKLLEELGAWCRSTAEGHPGLFGPRVLTLSNAELFGPLITDAFTQCAATDEGAEPPDLGALWKGFQAFFARFLVRLRRDLRAGVFQREGFTGPVVGLWANPEETHNGRQCVLRLRFRKGGALAYKPRPAGGEALFLSEGRAGSSLFEWLNGRPAASGAVHLPTMRILEGRGADRFAYSWQEWIPRPRQWGTLREAEHLRLEGCRLEPREAERFWHRAGSLTAACFALGMGDLFAGNVLVGARSKDRRPMAYPVDLEVFFAPVQRLPETGLINDASDGGNHHVGFERSARWCTEGGPRVCFTETRGGVLRLEKRTRPWAREETRSVVADTQGNVGFGAYLPAFLRGLFDLWTLLLLERPRVVKFLKRASRNRFVRVLVKPTSVYGEALDRQVLSSGEPSSPRGRFSREEAEQLGRLDVPYFFREAQGGPLLYLTGVEGALKTRRAGPQRFLEPNAPPSLPVLEGERFTLANLGVAVRDAVAFVFRDSPQHTVTDARLGVHLDLKSPEQGQVSFDWKQVGQRLTFSWKQRELHVTLGEL